MSQQKCEHCKLKFDTNSMISDENGLKFCCNGCKNVYHILNEYGFSEFYDRLGKNTLQPVTQSTTNTDSIDYIYKNYVTKTDDGFDEIYIIIERIHCLACIWLNEKILFNTKGIVEADINATTNKAKIVWDSNEISLKEIFEKIKLIGYNPTPYDAKRAEIRANSLRREFYAKLLVGIFGVMNIMWIAIANYAGYFSGIDKDIKSVLAFGEFTLATLVLFYTGSVFFKGALIALKTKMPNMDLLVASGASIAYVYSIYAMFSRVGETYFDSVAMIITFVFIGKYLEILSQKRATDTLDSLSSFMLSDVFVLQDGKSVEKNINEIKKGEIIILNSGQKVLIDGVILSGEGSFDYSSLSGESIPVYKTKGDEITSGAICLNGSLTYEAKNEFKNSTLSKIINLLQNATSKKPKIQNIANAISSKFSLAILILATISFIFWYAKTGNFSISMLIFISVIIIACPCAIALATPISSIVGLNVALKKGILFKEAKFIEDLSKCDTVIFDKTGTLTKAKLSVSKVEIYEEFDISLLYSLVLASNHPISISIKEYIKNSYGNLHILKLSEIKDITAKGMSAKFENKIIYGGSYNLMKELGFDCQKSNFSNYFFAINNKIVAKFELKDEIKDSAYELIKSLKENGLKTIMLSGDNENAVKEVSQNLKIQEYKSELSPIQKAQFIENLNKKGHSVVMVGDGINDALALSYARVSICVGNGADISLEKSDIVLLGNEILNLKNAFLIAKHTYKIIKQNLIFSLIYNSLTIPLAMCGYIIPLFAALSMSFSSIIVVLNALRIKSIKEIK
ncbi:heavy metal translocating P-type ATPase metal-binding domain-containing protein [Campylobacter sp. RM12327]|uniref:heavy metal translocating P-type ATPase n=1 Tax=Campylobacter sputorum TaxID=206 RepID=UPI00187A9E8D|nr:MULTISPECIES: heavy metal translocating P-type ATPase [unclassified Campylobacter]MBE7358077.1 heavy metal translocating P-type ATPase metal-binding domain-containing protein [Campylobacter sp. RM11302]MBF6668889.1 heavy metal translocating P-type ATPase metal-binding domain-containing protein [Campylobacter sp. RM12327]MBF6673803.1 heavy metal translocating P-type ATPase metal-binding domain-containing protein [Campylobacter sp. RM13538]MBF6677700.1 heavy metal translocating P-type ATPase m